MGTTASPSRWSRADKSAFASFFGIVILKPDSSAEAIAKAEGRRTWWRGGRADGRLPLIQPGPSSLSARPKNKLADHASMRSASRLAMLGFSLNPTRAEASTERCAATTRLPLQGRTAGSSPSPEPRPRPGWRGWGRSTPLLLLLDARLPASFHLIEDPRS